MATVVRFDAKKLRLVIYPNDHAPPHCHAIMPGAHAKFEIESGAVIESRGFSAKALKLLSQAVLTHQQVLKDKWEEYHGKDEI